MELKEYLRQHLGRAPPGLWHQARPAWILPEAPQDCLGPSSACYVLNNVDGGISGLMVSHVDDLLWTGDNVVQEERTSSNVNYVLDRWTPRTPSPTVDAPSRRRQKGSMSHAQTRRRRSDPFRSRVRGEVNEMRQPLIWRSTS